MAELGRRRGYEVFIQDLTKFASFDPGRRFDGVFCKGSNNPLWFHGNEAALRSFIVRLKTLLKPDGWVWITSCPDRPAPLLVGDVQKWLEVERRIYVEEGFDVWPVRDRRHGGFYGISVPCPGLNAYLFGPVRYRRSMKTRLQRAISRIKSPFVRLKRLLAH